MFNLAKFLARPSDSIDILVGLIDMTMSDIDDLQFFQMVISHV